MSKDYHEHGDWAYLPPGRYACGGCNFIWYGLRPPNARELESAKYPRSLRDEFAMAALQGMLSASANDQWDIFAADAYAAADAMMEARK